MRNLFLGVSSCAAIFMCAGSSRAQEASPEMLQAALQAALAQRDQALNEGIRQGAQISLAQREIARLRQELDAARKATPPVPKAPSDAK